MCYSWGGDFKSQHVIFHFCPSLDDASVDPGAVSEQDAQDTPAPCRVSEAHPLAEHRGLGLFVPATEPGLPWLTHSTRIAALVTGHLSRPDLFVFPPGTRLSVSLSTVRFPVQGRNLSEAETSAALFALGGQYVFIM